MSIGTNLGLQAFCSISKHILIPPTYTLSSSLLLQLFVWFWLMFIRFGFLVFVIHDLDFKCVINPIFSNVYIFVLNYALKIFPYPGSKVKCQVSSCRFKHLCVFFYRSKCVCSYIFTCMCVATDKGLKIKNVWTALIKVMVTSD